MVEIEALKSLPSVGTATFTIVRSRTVMIMPSTTTAPSTRTSRPRTMSTALEPGLMRFCVWVAAAVIGTPLWLAIGRACLGRIRPVIVMSDCSVQAAPTAVAPGAGPPAGLLVVLGVPQQPGGVALGALVGQIRVR